MCLYYIQSKGERADVLVVGFGGDGTSWVERYAIPGDKRYSYKKGVGVARLLKKK